MCEHEINEITPLLPIQSNRSHFDGSLRGGLGMRHLQTFLLFLALCLVYSMRVNISMAIVDMTDITKEDHFEWSYSMQSMILSSFFWGYVLLMLPSGELAKRFGGKALITVSVGVNALVSLILPTAAYYGGWKFVVVCRILQGMSQSFVFPSMHHLVSQWIPLEEKGRLSTIIYAGSQLGVAIQLISSGFIASAWGWKAIFYTNGLLGGLWTAAYVFLGAASPEQSKMISQHELKYIQTSLGRTEEQKKHRTPWPKIVTCFPFWAAVVAHCGQNWGFFTLMTEMPTYMAKVLNVNLKQNGVLSSLPYLAMYLLSFPVGFLTDLLIRRRWLSITNTRKLANSIGLWGPALALIGLSYAPEGNMVVSVLMLTLTLGINAGHFTGYMLILVDLAPNFSSSLMAISNFFANIISIIAPLICGVIIQDETDPAEWRKVFFLASGIYFCTNLCFVLFTTSNKQPWNDPEENLSEENAEKPVEK
ncbi:PREDICTED: putative inorganic phosphate cotransporter isoform X1 [Papilio xuthus]|uniref:Putative inorganic phosphate cotransporter n=1 Tax=Papilio xuthus TaxID=66420 RepID=A0AAJ7EK85_PAPXU|nr:PREDICTED: putative inorganic phosphate cotransporter isoform X1 [Papilio xuthus]